MALLASLVALALAPARSEGPPGIRAVWVTRWDYRTADDVRRIVDDCASLGANRVLFQVRGRAASFYPSKVEPWDPELAPDGRDPGWDPLRVACEAAARRGLALEAWINALPLWKGEAAPVDSSHPYLRHPEWVVVGSDGQPQRRTRHYVCANPALPAVRAHVAAVAAELAQGWPIDAVHLDYIRYVVDLDPKLDFSRDPFSLEAFGQDPDREGAAWARWKAEQVTATVRAVREAVRAARPSCRLTAAPFPTRASRARVAQDVERWVEDGLVDALYPMTYADEEEEWARRLADCLPLGAGKVPVAPGVGTFRHRDAAMTASQLAQAKAQGAAGAALFCYAALFESAERGELREADAARRAARVEVVRRAWR